MLLTQVCLFLKSTLYQGTGPGTCSPMLVRTLSKGPWSLGLKFEASSGNMKVWRRSGTMEQFLSATNLNVIFAGL